MEIKTKTVTENIFVLTEEEMRSIMQVIGKTSPHECMTKFGMSEKRARLCTRLYEEVDFTIRIRP